MSLYFHNLYSDTVFIAFLYADTGCGGTPFRKQGWWQVASGQTLNLWNTDLRTINRLASFYAEASGATWSGTGASWYRIPDQKFNQCFDDNTNCNKTSDFVQLDFNGYTDFTVTLGPASGQLNLQGSFPNQLDFDWNPIVFGGGVPVGGYSHLTIRKDGTYTCSGHFHDSGGTEYNMALVWALTYAENVITFQHSGHVSGTFESGSRDDNWNTDGQNDAIAQNWADIVARNYAPAQANATGDLTGLVNTIIGTLGTVLGIIALVV
jgi:hypothetical protein